MQRQQLLFCVLILLLGLILSGCQSYEVVMEDLSQQDANLALVMLREHKIEALKETLHNKKQAVFSIKAPKEKAEFALELLVNQGLPRALRPGLKEVFPPQGGGLIPSKGEELARMLMASQGEVEAMLKIIPGVLDARVVFSFDPPMDFHKVAPKKTASVALIFNEQNDKSPPLSDSEIKNLVASSISGLLAEDVAVVQKANIMPQQNKANSDQLQVIATTEQSESKSPWFLWVLTALALMLAFFGVARIFWERQKSLA